MKKKIEWCLEGSVIVAITTMVIIFSLAMAVYAMDGENAKLTTSFKTNATNTNVPTTPNPILNPAIIWNNGGTVSGGTAASSQKDTVYPFVSQVADDFQFTQDMLVTDVHWWGYIWNPVQEYDPMPFYIYIYADNGTGNAPTGGGMGDPSPTALATYFFPSVTGLPLDANGFHEYNVNLSPSFTATAGVKYWIAIQAKFPYPPQWGWAQTSGIQLHQAVQGFPLLGMAFWTNVTPTVDMAFYLTGEPQDPFSVLPGVDLWSTPCGGATVDSHFTVMPLPPGFFGPGSDPFDGAIQFKGEPLSTTPPGILGPADVIVERKTSAMLPACGDSFTVPIEIIALSLTSCSPITVTYNGGGSPELWDVKAGLSSTQPQQIGSMIIRRGCDAGGTFTSTLPVTPRFVFIRQSDQFHQVLDLGGTLTINFETERVCQGQWTYSDPGFGIFTSPGGLTADHDCNPSTPEVPVRASSNFFPGVRAIPCNCSQPAQEYKKRMTQEEAQLAAHGVLPPEQQGYDRDNDCIHDIADNCPDIPNPYQTDSDCDGIGDACEQESLYWKPEYQDYAPSGMPDLDQHQDNWYKYETSAFSFCGPVAVANCFKWFDSKYNNPPGVPGDGMDRFPLVRQYISALGGMLGAWDDHDPFNMNHQATPWLFGGTPPPPPTMPQPFVPGVQPPGMPPWGELVERLAYYFNTDGVRTQYCSHSGTDVMEMQQGIQSWFQSEHFQNGSTLADTFCEQTWQKPTFELVERLVEKCEDVILLLGFWWFDTQTQQWFRCGGHYVTVAGVNSRDMLIAFSDPAFDNAEAGGRGRIRDGAYITHPHGSHAATIHNDEGNVSHDIYNVVAPSPSPGGLWMLPDYPVSLNPAYCYDFYNQNVPVEFIPNTQMYQMGPIFTEVEYAVQISPWDYRGDANSDVVVDVGDVVYLINYLFKNGPAPVILTEGDVTCDGVIDVGDVVYLINYLFKNGPVSKCCDP